MHTKDHTNLSTSDQHNFSDQHDSPDQHSNSEYVHEKQDDEEENLVCDASSDRLEDDAHGVEKEGNLLHFG